jgi:hypothetical protein
MTKKNNDPFGFKKAIDKSVIDNLTPKELDEAMAAAGLGLSRSDFSDDGQILKILEKQTTWTQIFGGRNNDSYFKNDREAGRLSSHQY